MHSVAMSNIIFAVLFTDKYSITEIREQYGEQQHTKKSICNLFCFPSVFFRPLSYCILHIHRLRFARKQCKSTHCPVHWNKCVLSSVLASSSSTMSWKHADRFTLQCCFQILRIMHFLYLDSRKLILKGTDKSDNTYLRKQGNTQYSNGCSTICTKYYS